MSLNPGDSVPTDSCTPVGNFVAAELGDQTDLQHISPSAQTNKLFLASRKSTYVADELARNLTICNIDFAHQHKCLRISLQGVSGEVTSYEIRIYWDFDVGSSLVTHTLLDDQPPGGMYEVILSGDAPFTHSWSDSITLSPGIYVPPDWIIDASATVTFTINDLTTRNITIEISASLTNPSGTVSDTQSITGDGTFPSPDAGALTFSIRKYYHMTTGVSEPGPGFDIAYEQLNVYGQFLFYPI